MPSVVSVIWFLVKFFVAVTLLAVSLQFIIMVIATVLQRAS